MEGEVCVAQTPVPKTGWRASVRVRLLHLPRLEDDLAVARAPFAKRMDRRWLRFDSAVFRIGARPLLQVQTLEGVHRNRTRRPIRALIGRASLLALLREPAA